MFEERIKTIETLEQYEILKNEELNDISSRGVLLRHKKSGAHVALIVNDDNNKSYTIGFRTPVVNSTGVPHIIEHSVLCGSEKYPVKDPFMELEKGSLNTFLNAITYGDRTLYPVASCNDKDFRNLMGVYTDAVFKPLIYTRPEIFRQEGIRLEIDGESGDLSYNGVVYNEMKGAMSSPDRVLWQRSLEALFPDTTYGNNSGGEPENIRELTYEEFTAFHARYYHPSNSYISLYGDFDVKERLEWLDENYLSKYDAIDPLSEIGKQDPAGSRKELEVEYPLGENEDDTNKDYLSVNFIIGDETTGLENIACDIILDCLVAKNGAPVWEAVMKSGICEDFSCSIDTDLRQPVVSMYAKNMDIARKDELVGIIKDTLESEIKKGINKRTILALLNRREFEYLEADTGTMPRGIIFLLAMYGIWLYNEDRVFDSFKLTGIYDRLRKLAEGDYFDKLAEEKFLDFEKWCYVTLIPKKGLGEERDRELAKKLKALKENMSPKELKAIEEDSEKLEKYRNTPDTKEVLACIPVLTRDDMTKTVLPVSNIEKKMGNVPVWQHDYTVSGITYATMLFNLNGFEKEDIPLISLLSRIMVQMDTEKYSYAELDDEINLASCAIALSTTRYTKQDSVKDYTPYIGVKFKAKTDRLPDVKELISEILLHTKFDDDKHLLDLLNMIRSDLEYRLEASGHATAVGRAKAALRQGCVYDEYTGGIEFYRFIDGLIKDYDNRSGELKKSLTVLMKDIFTADRMTVSVVADDENMSAFEAAFESFVKEIPERSKVTITEKPAELQLLKGNEAFYTAGQVTYTGFVAESDNEYCRSGYAKVLTTILNNDLLYPEIRVKGGAYGAFGSFFSGDKVIFMATYRDSKIRESVDVFRRVAEFIGNYEADEAEMTKCIIGTMSNDDIPLNQRLKGERSFDFLMRGIDPATVQKYRDEILTATADDIRRGADFLREAENSGTIVTVGNEGIIRENSDMFDSITQLIRG